MYVEGIQKLTLLDYPGYVACVVFTKGCNFKCPFCHNSSLIDLKISEDSQPDIENEFWELLEKRKSILEGVVITGGEPLLQSDIYDFTQRIKSMGYKIKLDTNGSNPKRLKELVNVGLVDYVAMDVKNSIEKYSETCGISIDTTRIKESIDFLIGCNIPYEFRTTAVIGLHDPEDFNKIGRLLRGTKKYYIQTYRMTDTVLNPKGLSEPSREDLNSFIKAVREHIPQSELRG